MSCILPDTLPRDRMGCIAKDSSRLGTMRRSLRRLTVLVAVDNYLRIEGRRDRIPKATEFIGSWDWVAPVIPAMRTPLPLETCLP